MKRHPDHGPEQTAEPLTKEGWSRHRINETMVQSVVFFFLSFALLDQLQEALAGFCQKWKKENQHKRK